MIFGWWSRIVRFALLGSPPATAAEVPVWAMAVPFRMWNQPKRYDGRTFRDSYRASAGAARLLPLRTLYLGFLLVWPLVAAPRALVRGRRGLRYWRHALMRPDLVMLHPDADYSDRDVEWGRPDYALSMFYAVEFARTKAAFFYNDDKRRFVEAATAAGLPIPATFTLDEARRRGGEIVVKDPARDLGYGVEIVDAAELEAEDAGCVLQERLRNHPDLPFPKDAPLSTLRVITVRDPDTGEIRVWRTAIRMGRAGSPVDNTQQGGVWANIDLATGRIGPGVTKHSFGLVEAGVPVRYTAHPDTGVEFVGVKVPWWDEGRALALEGHRRLAPEAITLGWDVGLAAERPVLLEMNVWTTSYDYDPPDDALTLAGRLIINGLR